MSEKRPEILSRNPLATQYFTNVGRAYNAISNHDQLRTPGEIAKQVVENGFPFHPNLIPDEKSLVAFIHSLSTDAYDLLVSGRDEFGLENNPESRELIELTSFHKSSNNVRPAIYVLQTFKPFLSFEKDGVLRAKPFLCFREIKSAGQNEPIKLTKEGFVELLSRVKTEL